ncbi:glycosyl hydrolase [Actinoplanes sp. NPDC004185]
MRRSKTMMLTVLAGLLVSGSLLAAPVAQAADTAPNGYPYCVNGSSSDPDGDGWGWENNASCVVRGSAADPGAGSTSCSVAPADPAATTSARRLLCYLYSVYGNHILSGQQESTWNGGPDYEMNYIYNIAKKYPAIRGQDMGDSPDFGARGLSWWNAGGIPMVGYHMGSPAQDTDGYAGSQMNANISAALTSGTADNNRLNTRLRKWADQLKVIQNGGGAVIFRPWHEASGTWFWWSKEGASQYNRLWIYTYNFMRNAGVHNLVYLHPFNGAPAAAWYPGKQYVDIGGADTYAGDHGPQTSMYNAARSVYGSTMPIALHENGPIPDPAQLQSSGTKWVLFNTWHSTWITDTSKNSANDIRTFYTSSYVLTRDEVPSLR